MCSPKVLSEVYESIGREGRKVSRRSMFAALGTTALGATVVAGAVQPLRRQRHRVGPSSI
ncbi:hypothetical protein N806_08135 [Rhodococcus sp. P27]|nr:hypothetical protein N806_08135 [Rhodococcus sp. P27]